MYSKRGYRASIIQPENPLMRLIALTQDKVAAVDAEDYERMMKRLWYAIKMNDTFYAASNDYSSGKKVMVFMHREILGLPFGHIPEVDHENGDGLNNQKYNIRIATRAENSRNRPHHKNSKFRYKGVWLMRRGNKRYASAIETGGKRFFLGCFYTEEEAARAYDRKAVELFGRFARLNFPDEFAA